MMSLAFIFPGQGSQSVGMLGALAESFPQVSETFSQASDILKYDLWKLVCDGPIEELNKTHITQPAMLVAGISVWRVWSEKGGVLPSIMAGHSLGEYTALVCSGALDFEDAVSLVAHRGQLMQDAVPAGTGAMAAILGLEDDAVMEVCQIAEKESAERNEVVAAVNFNSPGQVVIAGSKGAVERAMEIAKEKGAKRALPLPVSVPSHCKLMRPAADKLAERLAQIEIKAPSIPVIHNYNVQTNSNADDIRAALTKQLYNPVRWVESIQSITEKNIGLLIECGPGKVLTGLSKRIDKTLVTKPVFDPASLDAALESC
ncbi:MAG: ACP S-malonyltransferase [Gammaproteobacteria bacterium]|nr:ACP S-malonyltransferase [Gammaproteobacteria bacterium]